CSRRYSFTAVSPSILITDYNITAQTERTAAKAESTGRPNSVGYEIYGYDWKFRTHIKVLGIEDIEEWGFKVGNKTYEIDKKPKKQSLDVLWQLKNSKKKSRTLEIIPYVKYTHNGQKMTNYTDKRTITLEYDPENNDWSRRPGKWNKNGVWKDCYESGFDMDSAFGETDVDMSAVKLAPRRRFSVIQGQDSPDDESDDFEIEMILLE
ncbi:MAG: hypothetical protein IKT22_09165, partial [Prevotella sp.]|nr:hypothetical protein [Prevotella sp.]